MFSHAFALSVCAGSILNRFCVLIIYHCGENLNTNLYTEHIAVVMAGVVQYFVTGAYPNNANIYSIFVIK